MILSRRAGRVKGGSEENTEWTAPDSYHQGGVQYVMADGSTRFISDSIAWQTWVNINTRSNGVMTDLP